MKWFKGIIETIVLTSLWIWAVLTFVAIWGLIGCGVYYLIVKVL